MTILRNDALKMQTLFLLSHVVTEKDNHLVMPSNSNIKFMLSSLASALQSPNHETKHFLGPQFSACEMVQALGNLAACSDENIKCLVEEGLIQLLEQSLTDPAPTVKMALLEKTYSARCCWLICMASDPKYREMVAKNSKIMKGSFIISF